MKILVTGAAGYIGSVLCGKLLDCSYDVTALDNFTWGVPSLSAYCHRPKFTIVRGDVRDSTLMGKLLSEADAVIWLAALVGAPLCDRTPSEAMDINSYAVHNAMSELSRFSIHVPVIIPTTNSGYGVGGAAECDETSPLRPLSVYAKSKIAAEQAVLEAGGISLRLATVFGMSPRMRMDLLVNDFVWQAVRRGCVTLFEASFRRNFVHVRDVCEAMIHALDNYGTMRGQVYNVGLSSANISKADLCDRIKRHLPWFYYCEAPIGEDPDKRDYVVSNAKIEATGWAAARTLDDGIDELIRGYAQFSTWGGCGNV